MATTTIHDIIQNSAASKFLKSVARNSQSTSNSYAGAILSFQLYLKENKEQTLDTIIPHLKKNKINTYELLDDFVDYLMNVTSKLTHKPLTKRTIRMYMAAVRSYLAYNDIDIIPYKFKNKVRIPKIGKEEEQAIDAEDVRKILLACNNRRLKLYLLILASSGCRTIEACSIRIRDINFNTIPTTIFIREEFSKTKVARNIYISNEATHYLKQWIDLKYNDTVLFITKADAKVNIHAIYNKLNQYFNKLLVMVGLGERKEGALRRKITLNSFRRFVKTVAADQVNSDYSEFLLGHAKSSYWVKKEQAKLEIYRTKLMPQLTFLDYAVLEATGKNVQTQLDQKTQEIADLKTQVSKLNKDYKILRRITRLHTLARAESEYKLDPSEENRKRLERIKQAGEDTIYAG